LSRRKVRSLPRRTGSPRRGRGSKEAARGPLGALASRDRPRSCDRGAMKASKWMWAIAVLCVAGGVPLSLSLAHRDQPAKVASAKPKPAERKVLVLSEAALKKNPITTTGVVETKLAPDLQVVGSVTYDQDHYAVVGPLVPGRIVALKAAVGDKVKAGQVLAI